MSSILRSSTAASYSKDTDMTLSPTLDRRGKPLAAQGMPESQVYPPRRGTLFVIPGASNGIKGDEASLFSNEYCKDGLAWHEAN
jgi:hypothetical protein